MTVSIEERKDYELYLRRELQIRKYPVSMLDMLVEVMLLAFDDGIAFRNNNLKVEIDG